jgi:hypothetical protein
MTFRKRLRAAAALCLALSGISLSAQSRLDLGQNTKGDLPLSRLSKTGAQISYCLQIDGSFNVVWAACPGGGGGGTGTVTSFSAGALNPLFTTSVSNPTTTPALSFSLSNFAAHGFLGNNTGSSAAPTVVQPKSTDLADFNPTAPSTSGKVPIWDQPSGTYIPGDPLVQGVFADGSTSAANPVAIGGYDTAGTPALHRATFINGNPSGSEYGIVARTIPSGTQTVSVSNFPATQAISAATLPLPSGAAQDSSVTALQVSQASTTSGQKGTLVQCAVTTGAPTYVTGQTDPLSCDTSGNIRANVTNTVAVSGTVSTTPPSNASTNVAQLAGTATSVNSGNKDAGTLRVVIATDQPQLTNKLLVTPDSVALPANQSVNVSQINGVTPLMGNGVTGTGSVRVTIASDNTAFSVNNTQQGTASQNVAQFGGTNVSTGTGASGAGIPRVTIANDSSMVGTLADNGAAAGTNRFGVLPSIYQTSYLNGTAATQGRNGALSQGTDGLLWVGNLPAIRPASYVATAAFAGSSTTDNARLPGNASNTVLVTKIVVSCTQTTAGNLTLTINKRSTAGSGGTSANMTVVPMDSNYAAGVSVPVSYTGTGPTVGTLVGAIDNYKLGCMATSTATPNDIYILNLRQKPIVLRGTGENVTVNFGGAITGGNITVTFEWIETSTITP